MQLKNERNLYCTLRNHSNFEVFLYNMEELGISSVIFGRVILRTPRNTYIFNKLWNQGIPYFWIHFNCISWEYFKIKFWPTDRVHRVYIIMVCLFPSVYSLSKQPSALIPLTGTQLMWANYFFPPLHCIIRLFLLISAGVGGQSI